MRLRLATYNLESLDDRPGETPSLAERIGVLRPALVALRADVLCLQEVNAQRVGKSGPRTLAALDRLLEQTPYTGYHRAAPVGPHAVSDVHNLVILSRFPIRRHAMHLNDLVSRPVVHLSTAPTPEQEIGWDRPILHAELELPDGCILHVIDAHLRAPRAAAIEGQKLGPQAWRTTRGWAEGYFVAALKRAGQALEIRLLVDQLLDADRDARVLVAGDLNADSSETPVRLVRADVDDTGTEALGARSLVALEDLVPEDRRYTVLHDGAKRLPDHLLASQALARGHVATDVLNEDLQDEWLVEQRSTPVLGSLHAPMVAEVEL